MYRILVSRFSFIQFSETDTISSCNWTDTDMCLPVYQPSDVAFQFVIASDTEEEADALCAQDTNPVVVGTLEQCSDAITPFVGEITRYRISATQVLYYWSAGITTLYDYDFGTCFRIAVEVFDQLFCSNCFQRIKSDCHTSVIEYSGNTNQYGFNYCAGNAEDTDSAADCDPLILQFTNQATLTIPWTAYLQARYGTTPAAQAWLYDGGELVAAGIRVAYDTYPPTALLFDFGGTASGVVRINK